MDSFRKIFILITVSAIFFTFACQKETSASFTVPSVYRFNSPSLVSKNVYKIDQQGKKGILLTDSLGDFNRANSVISDSLNVLIRNAFVINSLRSITFKDGSTALLEFGKIDTTDGKNLVILGTTQESKYTLSGNNIKFEAFPRYFAEITNSFLEVNLCQEFTLRSQKVTNNINTKRYYHNDCTDVDNDKVITRILNENPSVIYDTISIERVNYIFSKY